MASVWPRSGEFLLVEAHRDVESLHHAATLNIGKTCSPSLQFNLYSSRWTCLLDGRSSSSINERLIQIKRSQLDSFWFMSWYSRPHRIYVRQSHCDGCPHQLEAWGFAKHYAALAPRNRSVIQKSQQQAAGPPSVSPRMNSGVQPLSACSSNIDDTVDLPSISRIVFATFGMLISTRNTQHSLRTYRTRYSSMEPP